MRKLRWYKGILFVTFLFTIFLGLNFKINISRAEELIEPLNISNKFDMLEFSEMIGSNNCVSSINIPFSSATRNITNIELNFTDIKLGQETKVIEDTGDTFVSVTWKNRNSIGVEINITEPTIIYGVYLRGWSEPYPNPMGYVQINGYDNSTNTPDNNILGRTLINMLNVTTWYLQVFNEPIPLSIGQYYLVVNGSGLITSEDKFYLAYNNSGSVHQNLHKSTLHIDDTDWALDITGEPLLHKFVQRVNISYNPEEINMTADIDGCIFPVKNGENEATGFLNVSETIILNAQNFYIPICNNQSIELVFNISYCVKSQNLLISDGDVSIHENSINWTLNPNIERSSNNHSVKFSYPINWFNLKVKRNSEDISSNLTLDPINRFIFIPNNTISEGANWKITANSPNIEFELNIPETNWIPGQELHFSVQFPIINGNLTFVLLDPYGFEDHRNVKEITAESTLFTYNFPSISIEGIYTAIIYWNNGTDAGLQTQEFTVTIPSGMNFQLLLTIIITISIVAISGFSSTLVIKKIKKNKKDRQQKTINKVKDVLNLHYIIVTDKNSGLAVYDQLFAGKNIDSSLITGFLQAIRAFGIELTEAEDHSQTIKLDYKNLKILMSEFKGFRLIFIMRENPSPIFLDTIKSLSYDIDNKYAVLFDNFEGSLNEFEGIKDLVEHYLRITLLSPFKITPQNIKINTDEKTIVDRASTMMKTNNTDYFFIFNLLSVKKGFQAKSIEIVLNLIKKKIFQP